MEQRERTVSYRRAEWFNKEPTSTTLERCVRDALDRLKTTTDRAIRRGDGQIISIMATKLPDKKGLWLHITAETPGESASIVPELSNTSDQLEVTTTPPPKGHDFLDGDAFLYVKGNDVCLCSTGLRDGGIAYFLRELVKKAKLRGDAHQFDLMKIANLDKVKLIKDAGIKEIELKATMFQASADYARRKSQPFGSLGAASRQLKAIFGKENDVTNDALRATLVVKVDHRFTRGMKLGEKRLSSLAEQLIKFQENEDDFIIVTKDDQRIAPDEVFMRSTVLIDKSGKTVDRDKAWNELARFYRKLESSGALEA